MYRLYLKLIITQILLFSSIQLFAQQKDLVYNNHSYESTIQSVQLLPQGNEVADRFAPSVKNIGDRDNLVLEFDDLKEDADYYFVYFIHCNADWTPSDFRSGMYVQGFNEFEIEDFNFSSGSKINYVHYKYTFPPFKKTGNYLAVVYRDRDKKDLVLSRRFMIYENKALVGGTILRSSNVSTRLTHQRIEATINYDGVRPMDPRKDITVIVRQNQRPDQQKQLQPTFLDEGQRVLRYQNMGSENDFGGGNEFRFFDLSTINTSGRNIGNVYFEDNRPVAQLMPDQKRRGSYFQNLDLNGQFFIRDAEGQNSGASLTSEYVQTNFELKIPESRTGVYLIGAFNDWQKSPASRLTYDTESSSYTHQMLLKQGWYDYMYWSDDPLDEQEIEGNFFETENFYEIFVYFRDMSSRGDELIGYGRINFNNSRR
jgi:hypothetical protein